MSAAGRGLLKAAGLGAGGDEEEAESEENEPGEAHPGKVAAMKDFHAAHADGDHAGMAKALGDFCDIHYGEK
jgi:hypothetical protein